MLHTAEASSYVDTAQQMDSGRNIADMTVHVHHEAAVKLQMLCKRPPRHAKSARIHTPAASSSFLSITDKILPRRRSVRASTAARRRRATYAWPTKTTPQNAAQWSYRVYRSTQQRTEAALVSFAVSEAGVSLPWLPQNVVLPLPVPVPRARRLVAHVRGNTYELLCCAVLC